MPILSRNEVAEMFNLSPAHAGKLLKSIKGVETRQDKNNTVWYTLTDEQLEIIKSGLAPDKKGGVKPAPKYSNAIFKIMGVGIR